MKKTKEKGQHGGARQGAGKKTKRPSVVRRIPLDKLAEVDAILKSPRKENFNNVLK